MSDEINKYTLLGLKAGKQDAFVNIYTKYSGRIYNYALSLLHDKILAEDITQACFLKIWERRKDIDIDKSFPTYIYTITKNLVYKETERRVNELKFQSHLADTSEKVENDVDERLNTSLIETYLYSFVDELPRSRREIFLLSRKDGLSNKEIACKLAISEKTVSTQIRRSVEYIKEKMINIGLVILALIFNV